MSHSYIAPGHSIRYNSGSQRHPEDIASPYNEQAKSSQSAAFLLSSFAKSSHLDAEPLQNRSKVNGKAEYQHEQMLLNFSLSVMSTGDSVFDVPSMDVLICQLLVSL